MVRMCILRLPAWVQEKLHCEQLKSFSPEWLSNCFFEMRRYCGGVTALFTTERIYSQMKQMWLLRFWAFIVEYLHCVQAKGFSPLWSTYMSFQTARLIACVVALVATVGLLSIVQSLLGMFCRIVRLHFHTFSAKNLLSSVMQGWRITESKINLQTKKS